MKRWLFVIPVLLVQLRGAELHEKLQPLADPTLDAAKTVLEAIKGDITPGSVEPLMAKALKSVFTEEHQLRENVAAARKIASDADRLDSKAREWLKPNALGSVDKTHSKNLAIEARSLRVKMLNELAQSIEELRAAQDSMIDVVGRLKSDGDTDSAQILFDVVVAIDKRSTVAAEEYYRGVLADSRVKDQALHKDVASTDENARSARELTDPIDRVARRAYRDALKRGDAVAAFQVVKSNTIRKSPTRYLGNKKAKEVHDLASEKPQCLIKLITEENREYFSDASTARLQGYDNCGHCIGGSKR